MTSRHAVFRRRPTTLSRIWIWSGMVLCLFAAAGAAAADGFEADDDGAVDAVPARDGGGGNDGGLSLPENLSLSWELSPGRVLPPESGPYPLELDGEVYWLFPVAVQMKDDPENPDRVRTMLTTQELLREAYQSIVDTAGQRDERDRQRIERIEATEMPTAEKNALTDAINLTIRRRAEEIPNLEAQIKALEREAGDVLVPHLAASLHAGGEVFHDMADEAIRNFFVRRTGRNYFTALQLTEKFLRGEPFVRENVRGEAEFRDATIHGRRAKVVDVLLIFPRVRPIGRRAELRLTGLGHTTYPRYEPGALMYTRNLMIEDPSTPSGRRFYDPALRKVLRAFYDVSGGDSRPRFRLDEVRADWLWMWNSRLYAGHVRDLSLTRGSSENTRAMRYAPILFVNDTARPQRLDVKAAGLYADLSWQGSSLRARFTDGLDSDAYWSTLARRAVAERVAAGAEAEAVRGLEDASLPGVDSGPDLERKADVMPPEGEPRLPAGILPPQTRRRGLVIARAEVDAESVDRLLDEIATSLWLSWTLDWPIPTDAGTGEPLKLFTEYRAFYPERPVDRSDPDNPRPMRDEDWELVRPPEVSASRVERLILARARDDLAARDIEPNLVEHRLYNQHRHALLRGDMVRDWRVFARGIVEGDGAAERVRARLSDLILEGLRQLAAGGEPAAIRGDGRAVVLDALNRALTLPDLFGAEDFAGVSGVELKELATRGRDARTATLSNLSRDEQLKANRLLLDETVGGEGLEPCLDRSALGALLNAMSSEAFAARRADGYTDVFFEVETEAGADRVEISLPYRRYIAPLFPPYEIPESIRTIVDSKTAPQQ